MAEPESGTMDRRSFHSREASRRQNSKAKHCLARKIPKAGFLKYPLASCSACSYCWYIFPRHFLFLGCWQNFWSRSHQSQLEQIVAGIRSRSRSRKMISRSGSGMTAVAPTVRSGRAAPATFLPALVLAFHVSSTPMMLPVASAAFVGRTPAMIASSSFSCKFKFGTCTKIRSGANDYYQYPSTNNSDEVSSPPMSKDQYPSDICDEECQEGYERIENALRDAEEELTKVTERILRDEALVGPNGYDKNIDDDDGGLTKAEVEIIEAEFLAAEADRIKAQAEFKRIRSNYQQREVKRAEGDANNEADLIQRIEERNRLARERLEAQQAKQVEKELDSVVKGKIKTEAEIGKETEVEVKAEVAAEEKETSVGTIGVDEFRTLRERLDYERLLDSDLSTHQRYLMRELGEEMGGSGGNTEGRAGTGSFGMIPVVKTSRKK